MANELLEAIEGIGKSFEQLKQTNDQMLLEERKGNEARAAELKATLDKISEDLGTQVKNKEIIEKRIASQQDRLEVLEALNDRPRATIQDKIRSEHKDLFVRWLRSKGTDRGAEEAFAKLVEKAREVKDVLIGTDASGGFAVPEEISRSVDKLILKQSDIFANVKVVPVGTSDYKELISINGSTSGWSTETGTRTAGAEPTLRAIVPTWGELFANLQASNWSLEDMFFSVENWLVDNISEGFGVALSTAIYNGDGSGKPTGMFNATAVTTDDYASPMRAAAALEYIPLTSPSSPITSAGVTADSLIDLVYTVRAGYRGNAKFAMNSVTQGHVRKLKDSYGQYLWQPSFQSDQPDRLLGYPVFTWEDLGSPKTGNAFPVVFGDFRKGYTIATRSGMSILRDPYSTKGYTSFYVARRVGGIVANNDALKALKVAAS